MTLERSYSSEPLNNEAWIDPGVVYKAILATHDEAFVNSVLNEPPVVVSQERLPLGK